MIAQRMSANDTASTIALRICEGRIKSGRQILSNSAAWKRRKQIPPNAGIAAIAGQSGPYSDAATMAAASSTLDARSRARERARQFRNQGTTSSTTIADFLAPARASVVALTAAAALGASFGCDFFGFFFSRFPGAFMLVSSLLLWISPLERDLEIASVGGHDSPPSS